MRLNNVIWLALLRAGIQGRSKIDVHDSSIPENASTKSTPGTAPSDETSECDMLESKDNIKTQPCERG
jgi:hypothetical protein